MKRTKRTLGLLLALLLVFSMSSGMAFAMEVVKFTPDTAAADREYNPAASIPAAAPGAVYAPGPEAAAPSIKPSVPSSGSCGHNNWSSPTYTERADGSWIAERYCLTCGVKQYSAGVVKEEVKKAASCTESGYKEYYAVFDDSWAGKFLVHKEAVPALGHSVDSSVFKWVGNEWYHYNVCERCGATSNPQPHTFGEWQVIKDATSQSAGKAIQYCTVCGCNRTCEIPRRTPKTGDEAMLGLWTALAVSSAAAVGYVILKKKEN